MAGTPERGNKSGGERRFEVDMKVPILQHSEECVGNLGIIKSVERKTGRIVSISCANCGCYGVMFDAKTFGEGSGGKERKRGRRRR